MLQAKNVYGLALVARGHVEATAFGFRPGRSAHQALQSLHTAVMGQGLRWVIDIDMCSATSVSVSTPLQKATLTLTSSNLISPTA
jgi:hypothetical protein